MSATSFFIVSSGRSGTAMMMLTPEQAAQFALLATPMMKRLGYAGQPEYPVSY